MPLPNYVKARVRPLGNYDRLVQQTEATAPARFLATQTNSIVGTATTGAPTTPDDARLPGAATPKSVCDGSPAAPISTSGIVTVVAVVALGALLMRS